MELIVIEAEGSTACGIAEPAEHVQPVLRATAEMYRLTGFEPPWVGYLALDQDRCVGTCAFKAAPAGGRVEIAYFTFPGFEGRGLATAMACELVAIARRAEPGVCVVAQTLPERNASNAILHKLGFRLAGTVAHAEDGDVWEWLLD